MSPEQNLWQAVILQAFRDAVMVRDSVGSKSTAVWVTNGEARRFLTDESEEWTEARELVCQAANFDTDYVRERAVRFLAQGQGVRQREVSRYRARLRTRMANMKEDDKTPAVGAGAVA